MFKISIRILPAVFMVLFCITVSASAGIEKKKDSTKKSKSSVVRKPEKSKQADNIKKNMPSPESIKGSNGKKYDTFIDSNKDGIHDRIKKPSIKSKTKGTNKPLPPTKPKPEEKVKKKDKPSK